MLREQFDFEYGEDKEVDGIVINDKCGKLARKIKEIIDLKSSVADWLNNQNIREQLKFDIKLWSKWKISRKMKLNHRYVKTL